MPDNPVDPRRDEILPFRLVVALFCVFAFSQIARFDSRPAAAMKVAAEKVETTDLGDGGYRWKVAITFQETAGGRGANCRGSGYIQDPTGSRWAARPYEIIESGTIAVDAGGQGTCTNEISSANHQLCNGYLVMEWKCTDEARHVTTFVTRLLLVHKGCPGPKK
ncbi:MAG: hypothetical protein ACM3X4_08430 [Ignavibacteriales bacterium]